jgi:hypothetical protein
MDDEYEEAKKLLDTRREWRCGCGATTSASVREALSLGWLLSFPDEEFVSLSDFEADACPSCARDGKPN